MKAYEARPIRFLGVRRHADWRIKLYGIVCSPPAIDEGSFKTGYEMALDALPVPAVTDSRPGVAFCVLHRGRGADYVVLGWWDRENELPFRIFVRLESEGGFRPAADSESFCVWDLQVVAFEREAYVATILADPSSGVDAYLETALEVELERTLWFDRKFEPGMPPEEFDGVLVRLRAFPRVLRERLGGLPEERAKARHGGAWSIQENVGHLLDLEPLWDGRLDDFLADLDELRPADLENTRTHQANHNGGRLTDLLERFESVRAMMVLRLEGMPADFRSRQALHPRLMQPMTPTDLLHFVAEHDDHHMTTIEALMNRSSGGADAD